MSTTHPLRVLIVASPPAEVALLAGALSQAKLAFNYICAATEAEYRSRLDENLDLILVDSPLPDFDALHALWLLQSRRLNIPIIIVTDVAHEEEALECLEQGADDYVFRDRLMRLGQAIMKVRECQRMGEDQRKLSSAVEHSASSVVITDLEGSIQYVNAKFTQVTGYTAEEAFGKNPRILKSGATPPESYKQMWQAITTGGEWRGEFCNRKKNGELYWEWASISAIKDSNGRITNFLAVKEDITERKQIEERLRASEEQFRTTFNYASIGMALASLEGRWLQVNPAFCEIVGYTEQELLSKTCQYITHPDDQESDRNNIHQLIAGEVQAYQMEKRYFHKLGHTIWVLLSVSLVRGGDGQPLHFISQIQNITERKQAEEKLEQERDLLRTLIDSTPDYIFIKDAEGRFVISNIAHAEAAKTTPEDIVGKTAFEVFSPELAARFHADDIAVIESGETLINLERTTIAADGAEMTVLTTKIPLRDKDGKLTGLVGISRDITAFKQLEVQALELAAERERVEALQHFISDMSHDFRTPLSILHTSLYLMRKHTDPQKQQLHAERGEEQIIRMDKLLSELLQMAQFDEQGLNLRFDLTDINGFLAPIMQEYASMAAEKRITLDFVPCANDCFARVDTVEFARAVVALVENAIAYTNKGGSITVRTALDANYVRVSIQDTGIGIADHETAHIFERFYRADQARSSEHGGSGLGLTIAQRIIQAHGGDIKVESQLGCGSTFTIVLPHA